MKEIYQVVHVFDVDGGFGDAIEEQETLVTFDNLDDAKKFVERYSNPFVYDHPYADLHCGELVIHTYQVLTSMDEFKETDDFLRENDWWLKEE